MSDNDLSYCELRAKEVVNAADGKRMGRIVDILFSRENGTVSGIVVPMAKRNVFSKSQDIFIPWRCVQKIGEDVILVTLTVDAEGKWNCCHNDPPPPPNKDCRHGSDCCDEKSAPPRRDCAPPQHPDCDLRCEKCMLFDCSYRWAHMN